MPNWCNNNIIIKGPKKKIDAMEKAAKDGNFINHLCPMPEELRDSEKYPADGSKNPHLKKKHGADNWYDWAVSNWGTKWDIDAYDGSIQKKEELLGKDNGKAELSFGFDSAWAPPLDAMAGYLEKNDDVSMKLWYYEPGCDFGGVWEDFNDDCWEISEVQDSFLINDPVGREFNDYFGLLESREEWREDDSNDPKDVAKWKAVQGAK